MKTFDWNDTEAQIIRNYGDIAVYHNAHGDIVIRQVGQYDDEDEIVVVPFHQAALVIEAIDSELKAAAEGPTIGHS